MELPRTRKTFKREKNEYLLFGKKYENFFANFFLSQMLEIIFVFFCKMSKAFTIQIETISIPLFLF